MSEEVVLEGVSVYYDSTPALIDVSLRFRHPFAAVVMGPNGAGKTTLLKVLLGLVRPSEGRVSVFGIDPTRRPYEVRRVVGYVPQLIHVDEEVPIKVWEVVAMGVLSRALPPRICTRRDREAVEWALDLVEMGDYADYYFSELSGGQKQRVLIARALVRRPKLLLLDEPFSMLDYEMKCEIANLVFSIHEKLGISVLMVAHELSPCIAYEPIAILLNKRVFAVGSPQQVLTEENLAKAYPGVTRIRNLIIAGEDHVA